MTCLTKTQEKLKFNVEKYRKLTIEKDKLYGEFKKMELEKDHFIDIYENMNYQERLIKKCGWDRDKQYEMDTLEHNINLLSDKLYKIKFEIYEACKAIYKNNYNKEFSSKSITNEFIESIGLEFRIDSNYRRTGNRIKFYIDDKHVFSEFEKHAGCSSYYS